MTKPFCSQCDASHPAAECPHRAVLDPGAEPASDPETLAALAALPRDEDWDREKGRWI